MSSNNQRATVHIGTHKTGSTSLQHWLRVHCQTLEQQFGIRVYDGLFPNNREIALVCADGSRQYPTMRHIPEWNSAHWQNHVVQQIREQVRSNAQHLVISSETLSFLRNQGEINFLANLLEPRDVTIIVTLRNQVDFLHSWATHLQRDGFSLSNDPYSFAYVQPDSWLADYDALITAYRQQFGHDAVKIVDYDVALRQFSSIIPGIMSHIVSDIEGLPDWHGVFKNSSNRILDPRRSLTDRLTSRLRLKRSSPQE